MARDDETIATLKRELGALVAERVRGWNGDDIGSVLGTDRLRIADLRNGRLARFSLETLIRFLLRGGYSVELRAKLRRSVLAPSESSGEPARCPQGEPRQCCLQYRQHCTGRPKDTGRLEAGPG